MIQEIGITKAELARELGVSRAYVSKLINGKRKPSKYIINKLQYLGVNRLKRTSGLKIRVSTVQLCPSALLMILLMPVLSI